MKLWFQFHGQLSCGISMGMWMCPWFPMARSHPFAVVLGRGFLDKPKHVGGGMPEAVGGGVFYQ